MKRLSSSSVTVLLPAPPVPVIADHRDAGAGGRPLARAAASRSAVVEHAVLERREHRARSSRSSAPGRDRGRGRSATRRACDGRALDEVVDHPGQPERHAVVGVVDPLDAVRLQLLDLLRRDRAAAAAEHADVPGAALARACRPRT